MQTHRKHNGHTLDTTKVKVAKLSRVVNYWQPLPGVLAFLSPRPSRVFALVLLSDG